MKKISVLVLVALGFVAACGRGADPEGLALLLAQVPEIGSGVLYVSNETDGSCTTDCPRPGLSRGKVVECADLSAVHDDYEQLLVAGGFTQKADDTWTKDADDRTLEVHVLALTDAGTGPQPNEQPYVDSPGDLSGACAIFVRAAIES